MSWKRLNEWLNAQVGAASAAPTSSRPRFICGPCGEPNGRHTKDCPVGLNEANHRANPRHWKLTGGSSDYYKVEVQSPTTGPTPYMAECNDIIEALGMNFAEGNAFKALWRSASARLGNGKPGLTAVYDAEKIVFFGLRMLDMAKQAEQNSNHG